MSISKHEYQCNPAAKRIWVAVMEKYEPSVVKPRRSCIAALRRLIAEIDRSSTQTIGQITCPLTDIITEHLCLNTLSVKDQNAILSLWEWMLGLKG